MNAGIIQQQQYYVMSLFLKYISKIVLSSVKIYNVLNNYIFCVKAG